MVRNILSENGLNEYININRLLSVIYFIIFAGCFCLSLIALDTHQNHTFFGLLGYTLFLGILGIIFYIDYRYFNIKKLLLNLDKYTRIKKKLDHGKY